MTDIPYTQEEGELVDAVIYWLLDQDHDSFDGQYLWFLTEDQEMPSSDEDLERVRELLNSAAGKASRGVTQEDVDEVALDDNERHSVDITPEARAAVEALLHPTEAVYVVIDPEGEPEEWHVEVLDQAPRWNTYGQVVKLAGINGGDSATVHPRPGTADRADVTMRLAEVFGYTIVDRELGTEEAMLRVFSYIEGIVNEYRDDGDQMVEAFCICQVGPGGHRILNPVCPGHGVNS